MFAKKTLLAMAYLSVVIALTSVSFSQLLELNFCKRHYVAAAGRDGVCTGTAACHLEVSSCLIGGWPTAFSYRKNEVEKQYDGCTTDPVSECYIPIPNVMVNCMDWDVYDAAGCLNYQCSLSYPIADCL
jgi:hypothetical protein